MAASVSSSVALWPQISRCTYSSRLRHKSRRRGKLLGLPTSMAFEYVGLAWRGWNSPVRRYCGTTSLALVEATKRATGKPMRLAKISAGHGNDQWHGGDRELAVRSHVIEHLRQQAPDVDGIRGG